MNKPLTTRQLQILTVLKAHPSETLRELGLRLGIRHVSVLQALQALEERGLCTTKPRAITAAGKEALRTAAANLRAALAAVA
jgi:DNA-binding MarR family transcriptional regulator